MSQSDAGRQPPNAQLTPEQSAALGAMAAKAAEAVAPRLLELGQRWWASLQSDSTAAPPPGWVTAEDFDRTGVLLSAEVLQACTSLDPEIARDRLIRVLDVISRARVRALAMADPRQRDLVWDQACERLRRIMLEPTSATSDR